MKKFSVAVFVWWFLAFGFGDNHAPRVVGPFNNYHDCLKIRKWVESKYKVSVANKTFLPKAFSCWQGETREK